MKFTLQRLLVEKIEHRIIVGTVAFLGTMILIGWISINEGARMQAFERQYLARSIERGAALYSANCATCHGTDGRGVAGRAPSLNSPYLFGHDFLAEFDREIESLTRERDAEGTTEERRTAIAARLTELETSRQQVIASLQPAIDRGYDPENPVRMATLGWGGGLQSFIYTTLVHGRPTSVYYWPQPMAAWSQTAGGPLRGDQLDDLTNFILNWDRGGDWTIDDALAVNQYPIQPVDPATVVAVAADGPPVIGADVTNEALFAEIVNYTGDPQAGQTLYNGALACAGCHMAAAVAPLTDASWTRTQELRLPDPAVQELGITTGEQYLANAIIHPNDYISPGYPAGVMPQNFGDRLTYQQLADLIAYLRTYDQPLQ